MGGLPAGRTNEEFRCETVPSSLQETKKSDADSFWALTNSGTVVGSIKEVRDVSRGGGGGGFLWISSDRLVRCAVSEQHREQMTSGLRFFPVRDHDDSTTGLDVDSPSSSPT